MRRGLVLGCGGTLGAAWTIAALVEVARALAWDPRTADVIVGTSAGAELATLLGSGVGVQELLDAALDAPSAEAGLARHFAEPPPSLPPWPSAPWGSGRLGLKLFAPDRQRRVAPLTALAGLLPIGAGDPTFITKLVDAHVPMSSWVAHRATWIVAVDLDSGERVAFGSKSAPRASMRDAVRASWAIPGWFPPVVIDGRRYVDGGIASPASADLVLELGEPLDEVIVIAPMASSDQGRRRGLGRIEGLLRATMSRALDREVARLREHGMRVLRLEPGPEDLRVMGPNFMDPRRRLRVLESSLRTARSTVRRAMASDGASTRDQTLADRISEGARP